MSTYLVPSGPVVFDGEPETSTTGIRVSWLPIEKSFWNGQEITYKITLMENRRKVKVFTTTDSKIIFAGLKPKTTYTIILSGKTKLGEIPPQQKKRQQNQVRFFSYIHQFTHYLFLSVLFPFIHSTNL